MMLSGGKKNILNNEKGFASIEATVLVVLFVSLIYFSFGFFGVIHTAILHNIHARTYAVEVFRHRSNLMYFRSNRVDDPLHYYNQMTRLHGINTDVTDFPSDQVATERSITMGLTLDESGRQASVHSRDIYTRVPASGRNSSVSVNPIWIQAMYGLCLNSRCGG